MLYKAKTNLSVGLGERGTAEYKMGQFYKASEIPKEVDLTNFFEVEEATAEAEMKSKKTQPRALTNANAGSTPPSQVPEGDLK